MTFQAPRLRGIILREESDELLVVQASPEEIRRFSPQRGMEVDVRGGRMSMSVEVANEALRTGEQPRSYVMPGEHLYNVHGECVAVVTEIHVSREPAEITSLGMQRHVMMAGPRRVDIRATGLV